MLSTSKQAEGASSGRQYQLTFFVVKFPTSQKEVLASLGILVLLLSPLSVIDENDDDVNDDHVPSMIIAVQDLVGASLKFPAVPSADAEEKGTTTATTAPTAQTPCDDDDDQFYTTICYNPQLTSFGAYLCPQRLEQSTTTESRGRQQCCSRRMRREYGVGEGNDDTADNANRSGSGGGLPCRSHLASPIICLLDWVRGGQGNGW